MFDLQNLKIEEYETRSLRDATLIGELFEFYRKFVIESYPMIPPPSLRLFKRQLAYEDDDHIESTHFIWSKGELVSTAHTSVAKLDSGATEEEKETLSLNVRVRKDLRQRGIGSWVFKQLLERFSDRNMRTVKTFTMIDAGHSFCKKLGGVKQVANMISYFLKMDEVDWGKIGEMNSQLVKKNPSFRLISPMDFKTVIEMSILS